MQAPYSGRAQEQIGCLVGCIVFRSAIAGTLKLDARGIGQFNRYGIMEGDSLEYARDRMETVFLKVAYS